MTDRGRHYRRDIQGLRAIAVLAVVAFHAGLLGGGFRGVDIFFVISGFVIAGLLDREWRGTGTINLRRFYVRRIRRLLPALALTVAVTCAFAILLLPTNGRQQEVAQTGLGAMLISANLVLPRLATNYFADAAAENPLIHTWSLSVEEQFYLAFVALLLASFVLSRSRRWAPLALVAAVCATSLGLTIIAARTPQVLARLGVLGDPFYSPVTRAWEFGAGALIALATASRAATGPRWLVESTGWLGGALIAAGVATLASGPNAIIALILAIVGAMLIVWCGLGTGSIVTRVLEATPLVWVGDLSYSWYLWHWPLVVFARLLFPAASWAALAGSAVSLLVAFLSFRFVENPIRSRPFSATQVALSVGAPVAAAIVIAGVLGFGARHGWNQEWALGAHTVLARNCDDGTYDPQRCRWPASAADGSVLLLGDSQAWAIADGVIAAASALHLDTIVSTHNACPFVWSDASNVVTSLVPETCRQHNESLMRSALKLVPRVVVIADQSTQFASQPEGWRVGLSATVHRLRSANIGVLLISVAPIGDDLVKRTSLVLRGPADRYTPVDSQPPARAMAISIDRAVASANPGTIVFDPADVLCADKRCTVTNAGRVLYSDQNHLSRSGALLLAPALQTAIAAALAHTSAG